MANVYECHVCGVITEASERLCQPVPMEDKGVFCSMQEGAGAMCPPMQEQTTYVCGSCGRVAEDAELLCNPSVVW